MKPIAAITIMALLGVVLAGAESPPPEPRTADHAPESTGTDVPRDGAEASYTRGIVGSRHDLSGPPWGMSNACQACHVPHMQAVRPTSQPVATQPALGLFKITGQRRVFETGRFTPGPTSLVCLGCHDGTIATSTIGSAHALLAGVREGFELPDGVAWRDHPIGVPYEGRSREYRPAAFVEARGIPLPDGRIECISCHDPHNSSGVEKMLVMSNRRSALCLTCHVK